MTRTTLAARLVSLDADERAFDTETVTTGARNDAAYAVMAA